MLQADYLAGDINHALATMCGLTDEPDPVRWKKNNDGVRDRMKPPFVAREPRGSMMPKADNYECWTTEAARALSSSVTIIIMVVMVVMVVMPPITPEGPERRPDHEASPVIVVVMVMMMMMIG
jgi:hypothetical protein